MQQKNFFENDFEENLVLKNMKCIDLICNKYNQNIQEFKDILIDMPITEDEDSYCIEKNLFIKNNEEIIQHNFNHIFNDIDTKKKFYLVDNVFKMKFELQLMRYFFKIVEFIKYVFNEYNLLLTCQVCSEITIKHIISKKSKACNLYYNFQEAWNHIITNQLYGDKNIKNIDENTDIFDFFDNNNGDNLLYSVIHYFSYKQNYFYELFSKEILRDNRMMETNKINIFELVPESIFNETFVDFSTIYQEYSHILTIDNNYKILFDYEQLEFDLRSNLMSKSIISMTKLPKFLYRYDFYKNLSYNDPINLDVINSIFIQEINPAIKNS